MAWEVGGRTRGLRFLKEEQAKKKKLMEPNQKGQNTPVMVASEKAKTLLDDGGGEECETEEMECLDCVYAWRSKGSLISLSRLAVKGLNGEREPGAK